MKKNLRILTSFVAVLLFQTSLFAESDTLSDSLQTPANPASMVKPLITPTPPALNAKAYILVDADSGKIIAEKNSTQKLPPASLTKMMTLYVISNALNNKQIHLTDLVRVSHDAWKTDGSRMFIKEGDQVSIQDLLKGIIVDSGNDACVAMAEHLGGSELGFSDIMNQQAKNLGMNSSHFTDSTGLPDPNHYTTAQDLAVLGRALIREFPNYYPWYKTKWFSYNGIKQPNRNRLLWRDESVDGIKTGHTEEAGFCLVSSAKRNQMRLIAVVMGEPTDSSRADDSARLLNYGFRFFETHPLYKQNQTVTTVPLYKGEKTTLNVGLINPEFITIPQGQYERLHIVTKQPKSLVAPIKKGDKVAELVLKFDDNIIGTRPLYALENINKGGIFTRMKDSIRLTFGQWFGGN